LLSGKLKAASLAREVTMPERFADGFDPATVKAMMAAFDQACERLGLAPTNDALTERLAKAIVEAARNGERDPDKLRATALRSLAHA
jgi:hypothetical protein